MIKILNLLPWLFILMASWDMWETINSQQEILEQKNTQIAGLNSSIQTLNRKKKDIKNYFTDIASAKDRIEKVAQEIERLQMQLPADTADSANLLLIKKIAEDLNIKRSVSVNPLGDESKDFYVIKRYEFKASCTFLQLLVFMEKIAEVERILNISDIKLKMSDKSQRGKFQTLDVQMTVEAYHYLQGHKEDRGIEQIEKGFNNTQKANAPASNDPGAVDG